MGTGWRRAFCTSIRRDPEAAAGSERQHQRSPSPSPRSCAKLGLFSGVGSNPSTPRLHRQQQQPQQTHMVAAVASPGLRCRTKSPPPADSPKLQCKTPAATGARPFTTTSKSPRLFRASSNPSSPISPSRFALFKVTLGLSRNRCGVCAQSVKTGQGTAVFTAECSHAFHFPCIAAHIRADHGQRCLFCPVCSATWQHAPLLSSVHHQPPPAAADADPLVQGELGERPLSVEHRKPHRQHGRSSKEEKERRGEVTHAAKVYDDDEPLLHSPTSCGGRGAGALFNPIPEADDEDGDGDAMEEDKDEFQGFVVDASPSPPSSSSYCYSVSTAPQDCSRRRHPSSRAKAAGGVEVDVMPVAALVSAGRRHHNYVVALKVRAPPPPPLMASAPLLDPSCRAPVDLVTVLDVRGSMTGAKLQMLKRAMRLLISSLAPADRLAVVAFSSIAAKRLVPLRGMSPQGRRSARHIVDRLVVCNGQGQGTCVGEALWKATKVLEDRRERNPVATIMLLSDGQQHQQQGEDSDGKGRHYLSYNPRDSCRPLPSSAATTRFAHLEIPIHESGFGGNAPQHQKEREVPPSKEGDDAFTKCVGGLLSVVLQDVHLQFIFPSGEISAVYSCGLEGGRALALGPNSVRLGDLYAEEERELLVELRVPMPTPVPVPVPMPMSVKCSYRDPSAQELIHCGEQPLQMPLLHGHHDPQRGDRLRNLFVTTRALAESRRLAEFNDIATAVHLLSSARSLLLQSPSPSDESLVRNLELELTELQWRRQRQQQSSWSSSQRRRVERREQAVVASGDGGEPLTPTSAWRAAERLAKVAIMRKSLNRVSDLHGFENARF